MNRRTLVAALVLSPSGAAAMTLKTEIRDAVERYAKAWAAGDLAAIFACYGDGFILHYGGSSALSGDHTAIRVGAGVGLDRPSPPARNRRRRRPDDDL
jgi:hypothetical protein